MKGMRINRILLAVSALGLGALLVACDAVAEYTVVNKIDQPLITRVRFESDCEEVGGNRADYLHAEDSIQPFERYRYYDIYGAGIGSPSAKCVQVLTADRRLVLAAPYHEGRAYEVEDPLGLISEPAPQLKQLPDRAGPDQIVEGLREEPVRNAIAIVLLVIGALLFLLFFGGALIGLVIAAFLLGRFFYRHYFGRGAAS